MFSTFVLPFSPLSLHFHSCLFLTGLNSSQKSYSFTGSKDGQDFVALTSINLRRTQNNNKKYQLRNFNVGHWEIPVRKILNHFSTHHQCDKIVLLQIIKAILFIFLFLIDFYIRIPINFSS